MWRRGNDKIVLNDCCLPERLFKVKKNGVFLFRISLSLLEILMVLCCANEESNDIINHSI